MLEHEKIFYSIDAGLSFVNNVIQSYAKLLKENKMPPKTFDKKTLIQMISKEKTVKDLDIELIVSVAMQILNPWSKGIHKALSEKTKD